MMNQSDTQEAKVIPGSANVKQAELLLQEQRFDEARQLLQHLRLQPRPDPKILFLLAVTQRVLRRFDDAHATLEDLRKLAPGYSRAWQEIGHAYRDQGQNARAIEAYERAVEMNPGLMASWRFLAAAQEQAGNTERARVAEANYKRLSDLPQELVAVTRMLHDGEIYKAEKLCRHFLQKSPHHPEAMRLLAVIGLKLNVYDDAEFLLESALELNPDFDLARMDYVQVLHKRQKYELAFEQASELCKRLPDNPSAELSYANQCAAIGRHEEALNILDNLQARFPNPSAIHMLRGHALKTIGNAQQAIEAYRSAYRDRPELGDAYWSLANMKTFKFSDDELSAMLNLHDSGFLTTVDEYHLCFALGKALEDRDEYEQSFNFYQRGNQLKHHELGYDAARMKADFDRQKAFFTRERVQQLTGQGCMDVDPIFIVGLPRAGSTLLEQILASHSQIDGTLELPNILAQVHRLNGRQVRGERPRYPDVLATLPADEFARMGRQYLDDTRIHRDKAPRFTDKMPNNFRHIGLILSILPNARIIDIRRDPMACCFSGYKQLFAEGQEFSYSLEDIGNYYRDYVELMTHWQGLYPDNILSVRYESLVDDLEHQVHGILSFLELDFQASCLDFHNTRRSVRTASSEQVRQPINRSGLDYWRHYEPWLTPLKTTLGIQ